jgi:hypothetical protein
MDGGDSEAFSGIFPASSFFLHPIIVHTHPAASNAHRWGSWRYIGWRLGDDNFPSQPCFQVNHIARRFDTVEPHTH